MYESSPGAHQGGVTLIDVACVFAVLSVIGWHLVPYLLAAGIGIAILIGIVVVVIGILRLVPFLLRRPTAERG